VQGGGGGTTWRGIYGWNWTNARGGGKNYTKGVKNAKGGRESRHGYYKAAGRLSKKHWGGVDRPLKTITPRNRTSRVPKDNRSGGRPRGRVRAKETFWVGVWKASGDGAKEEKREADSDLGRRNRSPGKQTQWGGRKGRGRVRPRFLLPGRRRKPKKTNRGKIPAYYNSKKGKGSNPK